MTHQISSQKVVAYFERLGSFSRKVEVTSRDSHPLSFDKVVPEMVEQVLKTHTDGKKIIFIGNGGSAAIASHMAIDYWKNGGIRATTFNDPSLLTCLSNDYGYEHVFAKPIEMFGIEGDLLIAISSSGQSKNILKAVEVARQKKCGVVTLSGFKPENPLRRLGDLNFYVPSQAYGFVEISHLSICHAILDLACELQQELVQGN